jgi:hypothetical protein
MTNTSPLTQLDYELAAARLGVEIASIKAMYSVESSGRGFLLDGQIKVNYEPHIMYRLLKAKYGSRRADDMMRENPDLIAKKAGHLVSQGQEHRDLDRATKIDRECALQSCSWGSPQIMGFHWQRLGFANVQAFVNRMFQGEAGQLDTFCRFIETDPSLHAALRARDWAMVASIYNGPGYARYGYDKKLADAYRKFS